ncbi:unnamed protein product [Lactuca saligna]|uniref:Uncharacterized protein n=1 Tax=Lactuca saligna TaxID=75948 RepID=A0AA35YIH9_LACSI|nr:unnamed protein product [Lactuca saligna]
MLLASIGYLALTAIDNRCNPTIGYVGLPMVGIRSRASIGYVAPAVIDVRSFVSIGCLAAAGVTTMVTPDYHGGDEWTRIIARVFFKNENNLASLLALKQWMVHLASPLVTSPPATSGLPHYKLTNDKLILITEWFHSQLGVRLLHRTDDYECDSSTTPVIASRLTSLTATLIGLSIQLDFSFQLEIDFVASPALHLFTKISLHLSTKIFTSKPLWWLWRNQNAGLNHCSRAILKLLINTSQVVSKGFCLNHFIERQVNQTIFSIYLTLKNSALNFFVVSNLSRPDLKQELLALGEQIGNAGSGLSEDFISGGLLFNMMIRVAAENQQACGNKSLYNDRVESFAAALWKSIIT